jgi:hypothetical protein
VYCATKGKNESIVYFNARAAKIVLHQPRFTRSSSEYDTSAISNLKQTAAAAAGCQAAPLPCPLRHVNILEMVDNNADIIKDPNTGGNNGKILDHACAETAK